MTKRTCFILILLLAANTERLHAEGESEPKQTDPASISRNEVSEGADENALRKKHNQLSRNEKRIYGLSMKSSVVYRLQTALGYTSTIDLPEPALKVFIGDQELFKVGVYEKEVVVKPAVDLPDARTNLTIITASSRLTFDVTVGSPETADFVLDFRREDPDSLVENAFQEKIDEGHTKLEREFREKEASLDQKAESLSETKLKEEVKKGNQAIQLKDSSESQNIRVNLLSISTIGEKAYLRFSIRNLSDTPYKIKEALIGLQTFERKMLGLKKEKEGLIQVTSEVTLSNPVPPNSYEYGLLQFDRRTLKKGEAPVFLLFEDGGTRDIRVEGFRWLD